MFSRPQTAFTQRQQSIVQAFYTSLYQTLSKKGPDHSPEFRVAALLNGTRIAEAKGGSKKQAEAKAAESALKKIIKGGKNR